jgi:hypothetical protein
MDINNFIFFKRQYAGYSTRYTGHSRFEILKTQLTYSSLFSEGESASYFIGRL